MQFIGVTCKEVKKGETLTLSYTDTNNGNKEITQDYIIEQDEGGYFVNGTYTQSRKEKKCKRYIYNQAFLTKALNDNQISFNYAIFIETISLNNQTFESHISFINTLFSSGVNFNNVKFVGSANFMNAKFVSEASFRSAKFNDKAHFGNVKFCGKTDFLIAKFDSKASFLSAEFGGEASFSSVKFGGEASFRSAKFGSKTDFLNAEFSGKADFWNTKFIGRASFLSAEFGGEAVFSSVNFSGEASFRNTEFSREANFLGITIKKNIDFYSTKIALLNLNNARTVIQKDNYTYLSTINLKSTQIQHIIFDNFNLEAKNGANRETFMVLKNIAIKQNDNIKALYFHILELEKHYYDLKFISPIINYIKNPEYNSKTSENSNKLLLGFEKHISYFGTKPIKAFLWFIGLNILLLLINIIFYNNDFCIQNIIELFILTKVESYNITHVLSLILNPILIYEIVKSLRKYSRKL